MNIDERDSKNTPMMAQWHCCKEKARDALLFFRLGDFYEAFHDDAILIARELDLTLTKRHDIPMCGVPHHTCEGYIDKLIAKGYKVAVAEQTTNPKDSKGLVSREVVRVVTPGTLMTSSLLSEKGNNFFVSLTKLGAIFGLSFTDLSTGHFYSAEFEEESQVFNELWRLRPAEIAASKRFLKKYQPMLAELRSQSGCLVTSLEDWRYEHQFAYNTLKNFFKVHSLDGFGLKGMTAAINAAGALINYLEDILCLSVQHISELKPYTTSQFVILDRTTQRNLELTENLDGSKKATLLAVLDYTHTPMGARLLSQWLKQPLLEVSAIHQRQNAISFIINDLSLQSLFSEKLPGVRDLERIMMRISAGYGSARDFISLAQSLMPLASIKSTLLSLDLSEALLLLQVQEKIDPLSELISLITTAIVEEPPLRCGEGHTFRPGYCGELDELCLLSKNSQQWLNSYQNQLRESTGIKTLKVGYTKIFGYYIEVSRGQSEKMDSSFIRRQTLVNAERFITPELKDFENKVLHAAERISSLENDLFQKLREKISLYSTQVFTTAQAVASLDVLFSLCQAARERGYVKPHVDKSSSLNIVEGRHPVIEAFLGKERFISNDTFLDEENQRLVLITGPNMAGKSTYIRQVALITIMALMGSYIPAKSAHIGIIDKIFTRIGASDDLTRGQSTFMVEMTETANILNNVTDRSLVILDEIGRGTSTYDGISIAWSIAEYLLTTEGKKAKTLFATHYWELTKLEEKVKGAINYSIAVHENDGFITFLRKIVRGSADKSYGIHVAQLAGLPLEVVCRAKEILSYLEEQTPRQAAFEMTKLPRQKASAKKNSQQTDLQLSFFSA